MKGVILILNWFKEIYWNITFYFETKVYERDYISEYETKTMKHIWGIKSWDDLSNGNISTLYTMNDFDITYYKDENCYRLGIETIYSFDCWENECKYLQGLLDKFTQYMIDNNYNIDSELGLYKVFTYGWNIDTKFESIEDAYITFKLLVDGYCNGYKGGDK